VSEENDMTGRLLGANSKQHATVVSNTYLYHGNEFNGRVIIRDARIFRFVTVRYHGHPAVCMI